MFIILKLTEANTVRRCGHDFRDGRSTTREEDKQQTIHGADKWELTAYDYEDGWAQYVLITNAKGKISI